MLTSSYGFVIVVGVLAAFASKAQAIKCFQCNSAIDDGCANLTTHDVNSTYFRECEENNVGKARFCRKTKYTILDSDHMVRVSRECGWILHRTNTSRCYDVDTDFKYEVSCQCFTDGCNGAQTPFSGLLSIACLALVAALVTRISY